MKYNVEDLYVGTAYVATMFGTDANGELDGGYKGRSLDSKVVATKNADGDYVSLDGVVYSSTAPANIARNAKNVAHLNVLRNVEDFAVEASKYAKRKLPSKISKRAALKYQTIANNTVVEKGTTL